MEPTFSSRSPEPAGGMAALIGTGMTTTGHHRGHNAGFDGLCAYRGRYFTT